MFPFYFSGINQAMLSSNPCDSINLLWNQQAEKMKAESIMFMTPSVNSSVMFDYPQFAMYGNNLLNPMLAIQQTMQSFQNGSWMNGWNGNNNWFNNIFQSPWTNSVSSNNSSKTDAEKTEDKKKEREYNNLKTLLTEYRNIAESKKINPDLLDEIDVALKKSGKISEKLDALKAVYRKLDKSDLRKTISSLASTNNNFKEELEKSGYNFCLKDYSYNNVKDADLRTRISAIHEEIVNINLNGEKQKIDSLANVIEWDQSGDNTQILRLISYWNDQYNTDEERSIMRCIAANLPSDNASSVIEGAAKPLALALVNKANYIYDTGEISNEKTLKALAEQIRKVTDASAKAKDETTLNTLADEFEALYVMLRRIEAIRINKEITNSYGFLNDIASDDTDFINNKIIIEDTEADLKAEGLENVEVDNPEVEGQSTADEGNEAQTSVETLEQEANRLSSQNPMLMGERFCKDISGYTNDDDFNRMKAYIGKINSKNVTAFLLGYYKEASWYDNGFFEQIAAERGTTRLTNGEVVNIMKALIEKYDRKSGLSSEQVEALDTVKNRLEDYRNKPRGERFANESGSAWRRIWGVDILDRLDDAVEILIGHKVIEKK